MEEKRSSKSYAICRLFAGILFVLFVFMQMQRLSVSTVGFRAVYDAKAVVSDVLYIIGAVIVAIALFAKRKDMILCIGFAVIALSFFNVFSPDFWKLMISSRFFVILKLTSLIGWILMFFMAGSKCLKQFPFSKIRAEKIWFIPILCTAITTLYYISFLFTLLKVMGWLITLEAMWREAIFRKELYEVVAVALASVWIAFSNDTQTKKQDDLVNHADINSESTSHGSHTFQTSSVLPREAYCGILKYVLLSFFTLGIWTYVWIYRTTSYLNVVKDEEPRNPTTKLLLCLFFMPYRVYWAYKSAKRIDKLAAVKGEYSNSATLCLVLEIFIPIISHILMQDKMNYIIRMDQEFD